LGKPFTIEVKNEDAGNSDALVADKGETGFELWRFSGVSWEFAYALTETSNGIYSNAEVPSGTYRIYKDGAYISYFGEVFHLDESPIFDIVNANDINTSNLTVGGGSTLKKFISFDTSLSFDNFEAHTSLEVTVKIEGVTEYDGVVLGLPLELNRALSFSGYVSKGDEVTVKAINFSNEYVSGTSGTFRIVVFQF
jgi:hypothetical protein